MNVQFTNPHGLCQTHGWTHVVTVANGVRTVHVSGQVAVNEHGEVVGKGDLRKQTEQTYHNLKIALESVGTCFGHVVKMNTYVVDLKPTDVPMLREVRSRYVSVEHPPASTLIGIAALVGADWMIEIDAIAQLPETP